MGKICQQYGNCLRPKRANANLTNSSNLTNSFIFFREIRLISEIGFAELKVRIKILSGPVGGINCISRVYAKMPR